MIFVGTEEVHYLVYDLSSKVNFFSNRGKEILQSATPTRTPAHDGILAVNNSVSKEFRVKDCQSQLTLLAKPLAKTDVVS